jgi:hypothetical protein
MRLQRVVIYPGNGLCIWKGTSNEGSAQTPLGYLAYRYTKLFGKGNGSISPLSSEFITSTSEFHIVESHYPVIITLVSGIEERNLERKSSGVKL